MAPRTRGKRLVGDAGLVLGIIVFALDSLFLIAVEGPHYFPLFSLIFIAVVAAAYVMVAYLASLDLLTSKLGEPDRPEWFFWGMGAGLFAGFFLLSNLGPRLLPAVATVGLFLGLGAVCLCLVLRHVGNPHNEVTKVAVMLGLVSVLVPMDVLLEIVGNTGVLVVIALTMGLLFHLRRKWLREARESMLTRCQASAEALHMARVDRRRWVDGRVPPARGVSRKGLEGGGSTGI